ncbi:MAG: ATPase domain-containing protein [Bacteroidales bacterium]|jgi:predicted ATP-dependent serine protease|nr:ATPase domain-containing protein [Bacteroidales bacterium]
MITTRMRDVRFDPSIFTNFTSGTVLDELLCSYKGLPKGVNYMIIGDPGVGKTTIILDLLSNIRACNPGAKVLFISAEMNEIDLAIYVQRFPKFQDLDILFIEADFNEESPSHNLDKVKEALQQGWDVVAVDSFFELQSIVKDEEDVSLRKAETMLLSLIKQQNKGENDRHVNTTFLTIQQVTKSGRFIGTNRLKHAITAMLELRLENPKNVYSDRYAVFSKHRRGDVGVRLYYDLSSTGDVSFNEEKFLQDRQLRKLQSTASSSLRNFADQFDKIFNGTRNGKTTGTDEGIES